MEHFDVYVAGFEVDEARAVKGVMLSFGLGERAARIFVQSVPRIAKRRLSHAAAQRYVQALRAAGAIADFRPSEDSLRPQAGPQSLPAPVGSPEAGGGTTWRRAWRARSFRQISRRARRSRCCTRARPRASASHR
jgi:hypothetical protein